MNSVIPGSVLVTLFLILEYFSIFIIIYNYFKILYHYEASESTTEKLVNKFLLHVQS